MPKGTMPGSFLIGSFMKWSVQELTLVYFLMRDWNPQNGHWSLTTCEKIVTITHSSQSNRSTAQDRDVSVLWPQRKSSQMVETWRRHGWSWNPTPQNSMFHRCFGKQFIDVWLYHFWPSMAWFSRKKNITKLSIVVSFLNAEIVLQYLHGKHWQGHYPSLWTWRFLAGPISNNFWSSTAWVSGDMGSEICAVLSTKNCCGWMESTCEEKRTCLAGCA